ncbi:MAG: 2-isopropylmalate synthase [Patescibacteria group bacterium]
MVKVIEIHDTTCRDGAQSPGCSQSAEDRLTLAIQLAKMGVCTIEAGFPIASDVDFAAVRLAAGQVQGARISALARANEKDIARAAEALQNAIQPGRIHTFIATSPQHMEFKLKMKPAEVITRAVEAVKFACSFAHVGQVQFSAEDASRSDIGFLKEIVLAVIEAGAGIINLPDTVGFAQPQQYGSMFAQIAALREVVEKRIILSCHCHNDLALAVANSLAAVMNGARQAETTICGIGERAGNTGFEPFVKALQLQAEYYRLDCPIDSTQFGPAARLLAAIIKRPIPPTTPVVGGNVFAHSSGIHQDGMIKHANTYEIMPPQSVGWVGESFPLSTSSGRKGLQTRLDQLGYQAEGDLLNEVYRLFLQLAETKALVHNADLHMLMQEACVATSAQSQHLLTVKRVQYHRLDNVRSVTVLLGRNGFEYEASGSGNGPVSSVWQAVKTALVRGDLWPGEVVLEDFDVGKSTGGVEALGLAMIKIAHDGQVAFGRGANTDIIEACVQAMVAALNHLAHAPIPTVKAE